MEPLFYLVIPLMLFHLANSQLAADDRIPGYQSQVDILKASLQVNHLILQQDSGGLSEGKATKWDNVFVSQSVGNISQQCQDDFAQYESDLLQGKMYALLMLDATGKPPSGILQGNVNWLGCWSECLNISTDGSNVTFNAKYYVVHLTPGQIKLPNDDVMRHGVCVPSSCSSFDVAEKMNGSAFYRFLFERRIIKAVSAQAIENLPLQKTTIAAISICSCLALLVMMGTMYDVMVHKPRLTGTKNTSEDYAVLHGNGDHATQHNAGSGIGVVNEERPLVTEDATNKEDPGFLVKALLCFSLYTNIGKLLSTKQAPGSIRCLHGIRFISMCWVILGHTYSYGVLVIDNSAAISVAEREFTFQAVSNSFLSVDSFFFLSGLLLSYILLPQMQKSAENGKRVSFGLMYLHRYLRLTPTYLFVLMLYMWVYPYVFGGPLSPSPSPDSGCVTDWWKNMLYMNNWQGTFDNMCMTWSWYLTTDMQLFIICVPLVYILFRWRLVGFALTLILLLASFITTAIISLQFYGGDMYTACYIKPYCRIGPYLVGVAVGWLFFKTKGEVNKSKLLKLLVAVCWTVAAVSALAVLYGKYGTYHGAVSTKSENALYVTVSRTVWGMAVGCVVIACYHGFGGVVDTVLSWGFFVPLSRLTYCAYLVHIMVVNFHYFNMETLPHYTTLTWIYMFLGNLVISYGLAFLVSVAVESPLMGLEKLLFKK